MLYERCLRNLTNKMSFLVNSTRETPATRNVVESVIIGVVLTALSYLVGLYAGWPLTQGWLLWLEVFAVFTSYSCTYLCYRERRLQYPIGAVSTAAYAYLFYSFGLSASAVLNAWLILQLVYGWFRWRSDREARLVTFVGLKWWPAYLIGSVLFFLGGYWLDTALGGSFAVTDVLILTGSILAQFLLDNKKWENWVVWFAVDVLAIYEYYTSHLYLVGFQYVFFLLGTVYGAYTWWRSIQDAKAPVYAHNAAFDVRLRASNLTDVKLTADLYAHSFHASRTEPSVETGSCWCRKRNTLPLATPLQRFADEVDNTGIIG